MSGGSPPKAHRPEGDRNPSPRRAAWMDRNLGRAALLRQKEEGLKRRLATFAVRPGLRPLYDPKAERAKA